MEPMAWRVWLIAPLLASCFFIKPDPPSATGDGPTAGSDTGISNDGSNPAGCTNATVHEDFHARPYTDCGTWANTIGTAGSSNGSALVVTPVGGAGMCVSRSHASIAYVTVESVPTGANDRVVLQASIMPGPTVGIAFHQFASARILEVFGTAGTNGKPYDMTSMKWWRLSTLDAHTIRAEYSADGVGWSMLGDLPTGSAFTSKLTMAFGVFSTGEGANFGEYAQCQ